MSDCPYCDWRYDPKAEPWVARPIGNWLPVVWDSGRLRVAHGNDEPNGRKVATGRHICAEHPLDPEVLLIGPVREGPF